MASSVFNLLGGLGQHLDLEALFPDHIATNKTASKVFTLSCTISVVKVLPFIIYVSLKKMREVVNNYFTSAVKQGREMESFAHQSLCRWCKKDFTSW